MGQMAIPIALALASTGATMYNTDRTAKKQDRSMAQTYEEDRRKQQKADSMTQALMDEMAGSSAEPHRERAMNRYSEAMRANQGTAQGGLGGTPGASDRYSEDAAAAALGLAEGGERRADQMSAVDAAGLQRQGERHKMSDKGSELGVLARFAEGDRKLGMMRTQGIKRNPWIDAFAAVTGGLSGSMAGMGAGAGAAGAGAGAAGAGAGGYASMAPYFVNGFGYGG